LNIGYSCTASISSTVDLKLDLGISTANAEKITEILLEELRSNDIDINKLYGISTDGASVMTGRKSGVVVRLRGMTDNSDRDKSARKRGQVGLYKQK
jgi:hypothetical protein